MAKKTTPMPVDPMMPKGKHMMPGMPPKEMGGKMPPKGMPPKVMPPVNMPMKPPKKK